MANQKNKDIKALTTEELVADIEASKHQYQALKFQHHTSGVENNMTIRVLRRDIARLNTELRSRELSEFTKEQLAQRSKLIKRRRRLKK